MTIERRAETGIDSPVVEARPGFRARPLSRYAKRCFSVDVLAVSAALALGVVARGALSHVLDPSASVGAAAVVMAPLWMASLALGGAYDPRILGERSEEFTRVILAAFWVFGVVAAACFVLQYPLSRSFLLVSLVLGIGFTLLGRWALRVWLGHQRLRGRYRRRTVVIGDQAHAAEVVSALAAPGSYDVVELLRPPVADDPGMERWLSEVSSTIAQTSADTVVVAHSSTVGVEAVRRLAWRLHDPAIELLVSSGLADLAGPRVVVRPLSGLALFQLDEPTFTGSQRWRKRAFDLVVAVPALVLLSPLLLLIAVLVTVTSKGGALYRDERVGQGGRTFRFLKFRTMVHGAESLRPHVIGLPDDGITDRYRADPRITPLGRFLRRWSLDELPQLVNVVGGSMSMVGPRPMLVSELPLLGEADHRRHITRPGLTGLWQVSGRKDVGWEERMVLDLDYVQRWSLALDIVIVLRTLKAVITGRGAY